MRRLFFSLVALCAGLFATAQTTFYVYKADGSKVKYVVTDVDSISFTEPSSAPTPSGTLNGYDYIDLALPSGTLWATCNVGATSPEAYGNYFAWGETNIKSTYDWNTYKYAKGSETSLTKYCNNSGLGNDYFTDELTTLESADDVATFNWGSDWRMPTLDEWNELMNEENCTWTWINLNGKNGYEVKSVRNSNSIFLPAAGYRKGNDLIYAGSSGGYWANLLGTSASGAKCADFYSNNISTTNSNRNFGLSVRPVASKKD